MPPVQDWERINRSTPRIVDTLPNGPRNHPMVYAFMAGAVPEVMLHLREMGLLNLDALTVTGEKLSTILDWWEESERRQKVREKLLKEGINPDYVIMSADRAKEEGLSSTVVFPTGNIAPQGAVIKATAIDPAVIDGNQIYYHRGAARVFTSEHAAIQAIKGQSENPVKSGDVIVLIGIGPAGTGMEETYQITSALKYIPWSNTVPIITDGRFSGVSTGACIGHVGPEALAGGPIGKLRDGDIIEIRIDRANLKGEVNFVATSQADLSPDEAHKLLASREIHPDASPHPDLPADTRL